MILTTIQAFFQAVAKVFSFGETRTNKQCETEVLKNKKKYEKKSDKQEDLLFDMAKLLIKYRGSMTKSDRIRVNHYLRKIKGVN